MTTPETEVKAPTQEQIAAAQAQHATVVQSEAVGSKARITQGRALAKLRDDEGYKLVEGQQFATWTDYCDAFVPSLGPATISQLLKVVKMYPARESDPDFDSKLAQAGVERLYNAWRLVEAEIITGPEALDYALNHKLAELRALLKGDKDEENVALVHFSDLKGPASFRSAWSGMFEKFHGILKQIDPDATELNTLDLIISTGNGLPNEYISEAAAGQGGAAPSTADGYNPQDVPLIEVVRWLADQYEAKGTSIEDIKTQLAEVLDERIVLQRQREDAKKAADKEKEKEEKERAAKFQATVNKLLRSKPTQIITFGNGLVASNAGVFGEPDNNIFLSPITVPVELNSVFPNKGTVQLKVHEVAKWGVEKIENAPKEKKEKAKDAPAPLSKEAQAGKKSKKSKKNEPEVEEAGLEAEAPLFNEDEQPPVVDPEAPEEEDGLY